MLIIVNIKDQISIITIFVIVYIDNERGQTGIKVEENGTQ